MCSIGDERIRSIYKAMCESRFFQEKMRENNLGGYFDIGEEAITAGALAAVGSDDLVSTYFRGEGITLRTKCKLPLKELMAWWMNKRSEGHPVTNVVPTLWTDVAHGLIGTTSSCLGGDMDVCCGAALAQKLQKTGRVVVLVMGDGAAGKGNFHEVMNFAALQKLPLILLVRANGWAMSSSTEESVAADHVSDLAAAYHIPSVVTDGNDAVAVYSEVLKAAEWTRAGKGPYMVECTTYRMAAHSSHDEDDYRDPEVLRAWQKKDPLLKLETRMGDMGIPEGDIAQIRETAAREVAEAFAFASALPDQDVDEVIARHIEVVNDMWGRA